MRIRGKAGGDSEPCGRTLRPWHACRVPDMIGWSISHPLGQAADEDHAAFEPTVSSCRSAKGATNGREGNPSRYLTARSWPSRPTRADGVWRSLSARAVLPAGLCGGCASGDRRAGSASARRRSAAARPAESAMDAALARPLVRQVGHRHGVLGYPGQSHRATGLRAAGRALRRRLCPLPRDLAGIARGDGASRG